MAVNQASTVAVAEGIAKRVHGDVVKLAPQKSNKVLRRLSFDQTNTLGGEYAEMVWLTMEHGFTYAGSSGAKRTLNSSEVAESQLATGSPIEVDFRTEVVISMLSRAQAQGEKAFESAVAAIMRNCREAFDKRKEIMFNRGGSALATSSSATAVSTTSVITINPKTWAPHIWLMMRNCPVEAYTTNTLVNTNADLNVTAVNIKNRTVTVVGNATDITALNSAGVFDLYFKGAKNNGSAGTLDGTGLRSIANLSSSSSDYLGISCANYPDAWNATQVTWDYSTADFTWSTLHSGMEEAAGRGFFGDAICQVPYTVWGQLNSSLDALRVLDSGYTVNKTEVGRAADSITYTGITGTVTVEPSGFQPLGEVLVYPDSAEDSTRARIIGSTDVTFEVPALGGQMMKLTADANTVELRAMADLMLWLPAPRNTILFTS